MPRPQPLRSNPVCPPRQAFQANKLSNMKIVAKDFHLTLISEKPSVQAALRVRPPPSGLPGLNADALSPKDEHGQWLRRFGIVEKQQLGPFKGAREIILIHRPGVRPHFFDADKRLWELYPIPGIRASKPRRKKG